MITNNLFVEALRGDKYLVLALAVTDTSRKYLIVPNEAWLEYINTGKTKMIDGLSDIYKVTLTLMDELEGKTASYLIKEKAKDLNLLARG